jgi:hypothetical protein
MSRLTFIVAALVAPIICGCSTVSTQIVPLNPALKLAPSQRVEILLEEPRRQFTKIALLESRGMVGGSETELLEDARAKAQALGADAIVRLEVEKTVQQPVAIYDPIYSPFFPYYSQYRYPFYFPPYYGGYRMIGGGTVYTLRALAIKYGTEAEENK